MERGMRECSHQNEIEACHIDKKKIYKLYGYVEEEQHKKSVRRNGMKKCINTIQ